MVYRGHHLVPDGDERDVTGRVVRQHVRVHPLNRRVRIESLRRNVAAGGSDNYSDSGVRECLDDRTIGAVESNLSDRRRFEETRGCRRWWKIVNDLAVIHSDE